jgi:hypothetical protein
MQRLRGSNLQAPTTMAVSNEETIPMEVFNAPIHNNTPRNDDLDVDTMESKEENTHQHPFYDPKDSIYMHWQY